MTESLKREFPVTLPACPAKFRKARLRREEASQYLREVHNISRTVSTLAKYVTTGGGPEFESIGATPFYSPAAIDAWVESLRKPAKSSEASR